MNLSLLHYATYLTSDAKYSKIATIHAETSCKAHIRADGGTFHVVNFDQKTGEIDRQFQQQGYADDSTWSRGQAWAIHGFAESGETASSTGVCHVSHPLSYQRNGPGGRTS